MGRIVLSWISDDHQFISQPSQLGSQSCTPLSHIFHNDFIICGNEIFTSASWVIEISIVNANPSWEDNLFYPEGLNPSIYN